MTKVFYVRKKTPIMGYDTWMSLTKGSLKTRRSSELKKLDKALKTYHTEKGSERSLKALNTTFHAWCKKAGEHRFKQSLRNQHGAVSQLERQIAETLSRAPFIFIDKELQEAIDFMESEQIKLNRMVFFGARVMLKSKAFEETAKEVMENADELKSNLEELTGSDLSIPSTTSIDELKKTISKDVGELCGGELSSVIQFIGEESYKGLAEDIISGMIPIYAQLKAGTEMVKAWIDVAKKEYKIRDINKKSDIVNAGDPEAALNAIVKLLRREFKILAKDAFAATANFASSVSTAALDGGTVSGAVVGTATAVANLVQSIVLFVRDIKEMNRANALLSKGITHLGIFEACPLLGCYLFCPEKAGFQYSAFSGLIRQSFTSWGTEGYVQQLEFEITKKLKTIKLEADRIMEESRLTVVGIGKGEIVKETRTMKNTSVQRLCLKPVTPRETDPLARIRLLHQIRRQVHLRAIRQFDKSTLKHTQTRDRRALLSDIRGFDKSKLKSVKTRKTDPVAALNKFNNEVQQFRHLDHLPISHTMLNKDMFARRSFKKGVVPSKYARQMISIDEWKKVSSIRGFRTKLTKTIDDALKDYGKVAMGSRKPYSAIKKDIKTSNHNLVFLDKGGDYVLERIAALGMLKANISHWLDEKKDQAFSKRRPSVHQLFQCVLDEEEALSGLMDVIVFYKDKSVELGISD